MNTNRLLAASMTALVITAGSSSARASNPQSASQPAPRTPSQANQSGTVPASTHPVRMPPEAPLSIHEGAVPVGKPAPSFRIRALDGAMVRLDELAYPGRNKRYAPKRPVFVDFFRTDCQPCIKALPQLIQMHNEHAGNGLKVLMVALLEQDRGEEKLEAFLAQHPVPFTVVKDLSDHVAEKFMGPRVSLPATFLIDREGIVRGAKFSARGDLQAYFGPALASVMAHHAAASAP